LLRECQLAFRVGPTEGPLRVSDRSKCYRTLPKRPRKSLILRYLQTCQGSGVSSILIGRSIKISNLHRFKQLPIFHHFPKCCRISLSVRTSVGFPLRLRAEKNRQVWPIQDVTFLARFGVVLAPPQYRTLLRLRCSFESDQASAVFPNRASALGEAIDELGLADS